MTPAVLTTVLTKVSQPCYRRVGNHVVCGVTYHAIQAVSSQALNHDINHVIHDISNHMALTNDGILGVISLV